ncbi:hypothetical protein BHM03_00002146 [Ensete ventricosum]|uniref:Uncharacterized protein n=1 Tax=Ensete ventricosum TaxID=4639 RepID=A0A445M9N2_ENSVE|nr:hypothetical protein BHM03_00002146 [Ensete ventricosum]
MVARLSSRLRKRMVAIGEEQHWINDDSGSSLQSNNERFLHCSPCVADKGGQRLRDGNAAKGSDCDGWIA